MAHGSSPAYELHAQHPSGSQCARPAALSRPAAAGGSLSAVSSACRRYADYLDDLCGIVQLKKRVKRRCEVLRVEKGPDGAFDVRVRSRKADGAEREETLRSRYVVWAAGELAYQRERRTCRGHVRDMSATCLQASSSTRAKAETAWAGRSSACTIRGWRLSASSGRKEEMTQ